jgi:uncharacterized 2Fe-2S/4Fe-4S cluster protein (DUF4445 family)
MKTNRKSRHQTKSDNVYKCGTGEMKHAAGKNENGIIKTGENKIEKIS